MNKETIDKLVISIRKIQDNKYKDKVDNLLANHIRKTKDAPLLTQRSYTYFLHDEDFVSINLIDLAFNCRLQETLCAIVQSLPNLVIQDDIHFPTIIHRAMANDMTKVGMTALLKNPKWATIQDRCGRTFVHIAMAHKLEPVGWLALKVCPETIGILDTSNNTYAHIAMKQGLFNLGEKLLSVKPEIESIKNVHDLTITEECEKTKRLKGKILNENKSSYEDVEKIINAREKELKNKTK